MTEPNCKCGKPSTRRLHIEPDGGFLPCCDDPKCKEDLEGFVYDLYYRDQYHQGRSRQSYESSAWMITVAFTIILASIVGYSIFSYFVNNFLK